MLTIDLDIELACVQHIPILFNGVRNCSPSDGEYFSWLMTLIDHCIHCIPTEVRFVPVHCNGTTGCTHIDYDIRWTREKWTSGVGNIVNCRERNPEMKKKTGMD